MKNISVKVKGVYMSNTPSGPAPVVLLHEGEKVIPIFVGIAEAISINAALHNQVFPRPMTHDLMVSMLDLLNVSIKEVLIDDLDEGIYYARLVLQYNESKKELDARPSDCLALALRTGAEIFVSEEVFEKAAVNQEEMKGITAFRI
ncbi:MAG: bifunctional nuclease family protein [Candidatus Syntropharchaeia archaeon]